MSVVFAYRLHSIERAENLYWITHRMPSYDINNPENLPYELVQNGLDKMVKSNKLTYYHDSWNQSKEHNLYYCHVKE